MGRKKLERFRQNEESHNVIQPGKELYSQIQGNWSHYFNNNNPITVELACGRGEFTIGLGRAYANRNFVGVDIKGSRIWKGSTMANLENLNNVAFLRCQIEQLDALFGHSEIDELWITFPDPRPKDRDEKRRLTAARFLDMYKTLVAAGGLVHLKTDNTGLYTYTRDLLLSREDIEVIKDTDDFYESPWRDDHLGIQTRYEKMFSDKGERIKYLCFRFV